MAEEQSAFIVLGMHRSGTSALAGMLALLGVKEPGTLMPARPENPKGYWESIQLEQFHNRLLASAGSAWDDWQQFDPGWHASSAVASFVAELGNILQKEYGDASRLLIKDPRVSRFLPFWLQACKQLMVRPRIVISYRNPMSVARSLQARDKFSIAQGLLLWLRHTLDSEYDSRGLDRCFVRYEDLMADWRVQAGRIAHQLNVEWPGMSLEVERRIDAHFSPELQHHTNDPLHGDDNLSRWVLGTSEVLDALVNDEADNSALARLDAIRDEFNRSTRLYGPVLQELRRRGQSDKELLDQRLKRITQQHASATKQIRELQQELAVCRGALAVHEHQFEKFIRQLTDSASTVKFQESKTEPQGEPE